MAIIKKIILLFIISIIVYLLYLLSPKGISSEKLRFVVPLEADQKEMVKQLKNDNFIRSEKFFSFIAGLMKFPGNIEPGAYLLSRRMTLFQIADTLLYKPYQKWAVILPGLRREQIAEKLADKFKWDKKTYDEFLENAPEGYLFPDTYLLNVNYSGKEFAQKIVSNFNEKFDRQLQKDLLFQDIRNDTAVKIASLIESINCRHYLEPAK